MVLCLILVLCVLGSGRVTFNNTRSYQRAIAAAFVEIKSAKFSKKVSLLFAYNLITSLIAFIFQVQIDPYLEDATCSNCMSAPGPYFCREFMCFRYFCKSCWHVSTFDYLSFWESWPVEKIKILGDSW